jgi:hypothetical protein
MGKPDRLEHIEMKIEEAMGLILLDRHEAEGFGQSPGNFKRAWGHLDKAIALVRNAYYE